MYCSYNIVFFWQNKDVDMPLIFLLFTTPLPIKMVIPYNSWCVNNMIMSMSPEGDLIITVWPFSILVAPTRGTNLVSASSWSLDFSVTTTATCWVTFRQWFSIEKYITLPPTFFFASYNSTSIRLNNVSLFTPFLRKLCISAGSFTSGLSKIYCWLPPRKFFCTFNNFLSTCIANKIDTRKSVRYRMKYLPS